MEYDPLYLALLAIAGIAAGFINTIAGGGSVFTLPALMLLGLPADVANGTNRVGVVMQSLAAVAGFKHHGKLDLNTTFPIVLPTIIGSVIGASTASMIPPDILKPLLLGTMIVMTLIVVLKPSTIPSSLESPKTVQETPTATLWLFASGLYGGFVQAGVGFILLAALVGALRYDLVRANALKMLCTLVFSGFALIIFIIQDQVLWVPGLVMGVSTIIGVHFSVKFAISAQQSTLKWALLGMALLVAVAALFN